MGIVIMIQMIFKRRVIIGLKKLPYNSLTYHPGNY